jgi:hypothetical protein
MSARATADIRPSPGRATDHPVVSREVLHKVKVEVVAQEGPSEAGRLDVVFGRVMIAAEREDRVGGRPEERRVDDVPHARRDRGIDEGLVLVDPPLVFRGGDHKQRVHTLKCRGRGSAVVVAERERHGARQLGCLRDHAHGKPLRDPGARDALGDHAAEHSGRAGDGEIGK